MCLSCMAFKVFYNELSKFLDRSFNFVVQYTRVVRPISIETILPFGIDDKTFSITLTCAFKLRYKYQVILRFWFLNDNIHQISKISTHWTNNYRSPFFFTFFREFANMFLMEKSFMKSEVFTKFEIKCCQLLTVDNHRSYYRLQPNQWLA